MTVLQNYHWLQFSFWPFLALAIIAFGFLLLSVAWTIGFRLIWKEPADLSADELNAVAGTHPPSTSGHH